jgi:hypothetical protein
MKTMLKEVLKFWTFLAATLLGAVFGIWVSPDKWGPVTPELVTFFGIQAAAILPAMIFSAGVLRPQGVNVENIDKFQAAVNFQMAFWIILLSMNFVAVISLILAKALNWNLVFFPGSKVEFNASWMLSALNAFFSSLVIFNIVPFVRGVFSLNKLNGLLTRQAMIDSNIRKAEETKSKSIPFQLPEGFGQIAKDEDSDN